MSGYIESLAVEANQVVRKDDILFHLDDGDYRIAFLEAEAKLVTQKRTLERIKAQIDVSRTKLDAAETEKVSAKVSAIAVESNTDLTLNRTTELQEKNFVPQSKVDNAQSALDQARANVTRAQGPD